MAKERYEFQAETKQLLDLMIHSIYTNQEIFLRELISNASDAIDKLHYESLTNRDLLEGNDSFSIHLAVDGNKLTIADNGIGMDKQDIVNDLGTIARSGQKPFSNASVRRRKAVRICPTRNLSASSASGFTRPSW